MLLNEEKMLVSKLAQIIYEVYKIDISDKKLLKELLLDISRPIEKSLKELIVFVITFELLLNILESIEKLLKELIVLIITIDLIKRIKDAYKEDKIL